MHTTLQKTFPAMGTVHTITLNGENHSELAERMKREVLRMDRAWSVFRDDSTLSKLNRSAGIAEVSVDDDTFALLKASVLLCEQTDGAFDVTSGALSSLWREAARQGRMPEKAALQAAKKRVNARSIVLNEADRTAYLPKAGQTVDFGGVAKGFAADRLRAMLLSEGVSDALLNLGGTVTAIGQPVSIGVRNPFAPQSDPIGTLTVSNRSIVTSGSYERFHAIGGRRYHHILDPRTGYPSESGLVSVTLIGSNATELDALATGIFVLGVERGLPILKERNIDAIFVTITGEVLITETLKDMFSLRKDLCTA